ncbi:MAG TPA: VOC family protein [Bacillota bacterium]|nr:VOC family protein [Bacillota bacterium]
MLIKTVHHIAFRAENIEKTVDFYTALGCTETARWGEPGCMGIMMEIGESKIKLELFDRGNEFCTDGKYRHIAFATDDVDGCFRTALENGATVYIAPEDIVIDSQPKRIPARIAFVYGPDGEEIEFFDEKSK